MLHFTSYSSFTTAELLQYIVAVAQASHTAHRRQHGEIEIEIIRGLPAMEARPSRIECSEPNEQPEAKDPGRVFHAERVAPRDATESVTEQLAHGGSGSDDGVIDETYDTRIKIAEALEASARAIGDKHVEPSDAAAIRVAEASAAGRGAPAIPGGVSVRALAAGAANARAARDEDKVTMADVLTVIKASW
jgi:hypothetical protein